MTIKCCRCQYYDKVLSLSILGHALSFKLDSPLLVRSPTDLVFGSGMTKYRFLRG